MSKKPKIWEGITIRADKVDSNGDIYPKDVLEKAVNEFNKRQSEDRLNRENQEIKIYFDDNNLKVRIIEDE